MGYEDDVELMGVLAHFKLGPSSLLGHGGEAWVFELGSDRVVRILHSGGEVDGITRSHALIAELALGPHDFELPELLDVGSLNGRVFAIERRLPGNSVLRELVTCKSRHRPRLIESFLSTAAALGDLHLEPRARFGDLLSADAVTSMTWRSFLFERAARNLSRSIRELRAIDPSELADALPEPNAGAFVHLDAFPGNMLTDGKRITAVLDFGASCAYGDRRIDPISAAVYLEAPEICPHVEASDIDVARTWLRTAGLEQWLEPARRWLAAYWAFAVDDSKVLAWSRRTLT